MNLDKRYHLYIMFYWLYVFECGVQSMNFDEYERT